MLPFDSSIYDTGAPVVLVENSSIAVRRDPTSRGYNDKLMKTMKKILSDLTCAMVLTNSFENRTIPLDAIISTLRSI
jgi:hypothetical protein